MVNCLRLRSQVPAIAAEPIAIAAEPIAGIKTGRLELEGSLRELEKCFAALACFSPRTHLALDLYAAGPLSLEGPPGTVSSIPGLPQLTDIALARETCRVRRCALSHIAGKGRIRRMSLLLFCFDAWKMTMYCRLQFDLGKEETVEQTLRHESTLAAYRCKLVEEDRHLEDLVRKQRDDRAKATQKESTAPDTPASNGVALSQLLDEAEQEVDLAHHQERVVSRLMDRVEQLELEKSLLQEQLLQAQVACWQQEQCPKAPSACTGHPFDQRDKFQVAQKSGSLPLKQRFAAAAEKARLLNKLPSPIPLKRGEKAPGGPLADKLLNAGSEMAFLLGSVGGAAFKVL